MRKKNTENHAEKESVRRRMKNMWRKEDEKKESEEIVNSEKKWKNEKK